MDLLNKLEQSIQALSVRLLNSLDSIETSSSEMVDSSLALVQMMNTTSRALRESTDICIESSEQLQSFIISLDHSSLSLQQIELDL